MSNYEIETDGIVVRARPAFLEEQSAPDDGRWFWAYTIEIENLGRDTVQLLGRHWRITDANGFAQEVKGDGVIGKQPIIAPGKNFTYTSGCPLSTPSGMMWGTYQMRRFSDEALFDVAVPAFPLDSPGVKLTVN
jgi:ApaG protein